MLSPFLNGLLIESESDIFLRVSLTVPYYYIHFVGVNSNVLFNQFWNDLDVNNCPALSFLNSEH